MNNLSRWMIALVFCLGLSCCRVAYADKLSECFLDMDQADYSLLQFEAPFMAPMALSTQVEHRTFHGYFYPNSTTSTLAIRSDDGSTVTIAGYAQPLLANIDHGQQWEDIPHSLNALPTYTPHPGTADEITINYSNTVYNGKGDLDGISLYGLTGSGVVSDTPIALTALQYKIGGSDYMNVPVAPSILNVSLNQAVTFQDLNNSISSDIWPTGIIPNWTVTQSTGVSMSSPAPSTISVSSTSAGTSSACFTFNIQGCYTITVKYGATTINCIINVSNYSITISQNAGWSADKSNISGTFVSVHAYISGLSPNTNYLVTPMLGNTPIANTGTTVSVTYPYPNYYISSPDGPMYIGTDSNGNWGSASDMGYVNFDSTALLIDASNGTLHIQLSQGNNIYESNHIDNITSYNKTTNYGNSRLPGAGSMPPIMQPFFNAMNHSITLQSTTAVKQDIIDNLHLNSVFYIASHGDEYEVTNMGGVPISSFIQKFADCVTDTDGQRGWILSTDIATAVAKKTVSEPPFNIVELSCCYSAGYFKLGSYPGGNFVYDATGQRITMQVQDMAKSFGSIKANGNLISNAAFIGMIDPEDDAIGVVLVGKRVDKPHDFC